MKHIFLSHHSPKSSSLMTRGNYDKSEDMIEPPSPPAATSDVDEDEVYDKEENHRNKIPLSNGIQLKGHRKIVSCLAVDSAGARLLSGSNDYTVRMYDFQGTNSSLQFLKQIEPSKGHHVRSLSWSPTSGQFLCVTRSAQAKIYDHHGHTLGEFILGDTTDTDLKNTKGHISGLTCGEWHPSNNEMILTSSKDGSLRIWDVNNFSSQTQVILPKLSGPRRIPVTTCAWDREGKQIAGGIGDGSIQIWSLKSGWESRPDIYVEKAHTGDITSVKFSSDGRNLLSRSFDGSLKVWDLRQMKEALKTFDGLPNNNAQTNVAFSPDEGLILTGTSVEKGSTTGGLLCFYDRAKLEIVVKKATPTICSVVQCAWPSKLNQICATYGDERQGGTHVFHYLPPPSERGAGAPRKKSVEPEPVIHNPHASARTSKKRKRATRSLRVIWDYNSCENTESFGYKKLRENIISAASRGGYDIGDIEVYGNYDTVKLSDKREKRLVNAGFKVGIISRPLNKKNDDAIAMDSCDVHIEKLMLEWANNNEPPAAALIISNDARLRGVISSMVERNFKVYLAHGEGADEGLIASATSAIVFTRFDNEANMKTGLAHGDWVL